MLYVKELIKITILAGTLMVFQTSAFSEPTQAPPGGNVPAPINASSITQEKIGGLIVGGLRSRFDAFLATDGGNVGVGTVSPAQKLHVVGGKAQADDFCLNSDPTKCLTSSGTGISVITYTDEYVAVGGHNTTGYRNNFKPAWNNAVASAPVKMIHSNEGACFITHCYDGAGSNGCTVYIDQNDGYWYVISGWRPFAVAARCIMTR